MQGKLQVAYDAINFLACVVEIQFLVNKENDQREEVLSRRNSRVFEFSVFGVNKILRCPIMR